MSKRHGVLTKEQARKILENPVETGYTYAESLTYRRKGQDNYVHPRMGRRPIRFSVPEGNFSHSISEIQRTESNLTSSLGSRSSSGSQSSLSGSSLSRSTSDHVDSAVGNDVEVLEDRRTGGRSVASDKPYEGLLKKAWNSVPNEEVLQWSTSQAGGRGMQRTMRYLMSSEEHGDKWWLNKSVDETTEYLGSAPGSANAEGVLMKTFVGGANSSTNFAANTYLAIDRRGEAESEIISSSGAYLSSGKVHETRKSFTASLCSACCWLLLLLLLLGLLSALLTTNCTKCQDGTECNTTSAETWPPYLDDHVETDDSWHPEPVRDRERLKARSQTWACYTRTCFQWFLLSPNGSTPVYALSQ